MPFGKNGLLSNYREALCLTDSGSFTDGPQRRLHTLKALSLHVCTHMFQKWDI